VSPVLTMGEAPSYPHNVERDGYVQVGGVRQPGPAPRFSESPAPVPSPPQIAGANTDEVLARWGIDADERTPAAVGRCDRLTAADRISSPDERLRSHDEQGEQGVGDRSHQAEGSQAQGLGEDVAVAGDHRPDEPQHQARPRQG
jgi:hypothetical protein